MRFACLLFLGALELCCPAFGAYAVVAHTACNVTAGSCTAGSTTVTTDPIDTTGATSIKVCLAVYNINPTDTTGFSDSKGNSYTLVNHTAVGGNIGIALFEVEGGTVGSGHTFTYTPGGANYPGIAVLAVSGSHATPNDQTSNNTGSSVSVVNAGSGSITPSENNELVITCLGLVDTSVVSGVNSGFTISDTKDCINGGTNEGISMAYIIQTTAGAVNPQWSWDTSINVAATLDSFKASSSGSSITGLSGKSTLSGKAKLGN